MAEEKEKLIGKKEEAAKEDAAEEVKEEEVKVEEVKAETVEGKTEAPAAEALPAEVKVPKTEEVITEAREDVWGWKPKTSLGREVFEGKITNIDDVLKTGRIITEPEIVDKLVPGLKSDLILVGGRAGKGGGVQRIPVLITAKMHRSGRRFRATSLTIVGNEDGLVGIGKASTVEPRDAIMKATQKAKRNIVRIKRGCGSWECGCGGNHSIPFKVVGKSGSVRVTLLPAPKGVGLVANDEAKKMLRLAGIKDIWMKTSGNTAMRINLIYAIANGLKKLYAYERGD